ncbi:MAG: exostosin family protein [Gemmatimonadetes bacterium]|nr:exostosin family protein [Gemmatimonadota bacterium]
MSTMIVTGGMVDKPAALKNRYYVHLGAGQDPIPWIPIDTNEPPRRDCIFMGRVFGAMDRQLRASGLTVYLSWDHTELPSYGRDVIVMVLGDEWQRLPAYAHRVGATFKCFGTGLQLGPNPFVRPSYLSLVTAANAVRVAMYRLPSLLRYRLGLLARRLQGLEVAPLLDVPAGYHNQIDLPVRDVRSRAIDVLFNGSIHHDAIQRAGIRGALETPKSLARGLMAKALLALKDARPDLNVQVAVTSSYHQSESADPREYSERLMDAKICVVPRGTTWETTRYYEALRYGCIVIREWLPEQWYLRDAPGIVLRDWSELGAVVESVLASPETLLKLQRQALDWYERMASEEAVAAYMATHINQLSGR